LSCQKNREAINISNKITTSVHCTPIYPIRSPPIACPHTEEIRNVAWFRVTAFGRFSFFTILGIIEGTIGPIKALAIPVKNITP